MAGYIDIARRIISLNAYNQTREDITIEALAEEIADNPARTMRYLLNVIEELKKED